MDYAAAFRAMYLAHREACAAAFVTPPTPDDWVQLMDELLSLKV